MSTYFYLIVHDYGNLQSQVVQYADLDTELNKSASNLNFLFEKSGHGKQFEAEVIQVHEEAQNE